MSDVVSAIEETKVGAPVTLSLPNEVPPIAAKVNVGPRSARLRRRANAFFLLLWAVGALPSVLSRTGVFKVKPSLEVFGWGLWLPGAGFIAVGGWLVLLFPIVLGLFSISMVAWAMSGMLVAPVLIWVLAAIAAACLAGPELQPYTPIVVPVVTLAIVIKKFSDEFRLNRAEARRGVERMQYLDEAVSSLEVVSKDAQLSAMRELSLDELKALRYMLNLSLRPVDHFDGFTKKDNIRLAALRHQLNYISYGLAAFQCKYAPNFHGYLSRAQRFAIESLTDPDVCGYWKLESMWGKLKWNPDPVGTIDNIMLTGWSLIGISTYGANTGDLRYHERGALKFKPFKKRSVTFDHDAHSFVQSLLRNWNHCSLYLYPCEPFWSFPLSNALAFCGLVPYDRVNGTGFAASIRGAFLRTFEEEFLQADGNPKAVVSTLTGYSSLSRKNAQVELTFLLALARFTNAIHPGYARRWYALVRVEFLELVSGDLSLKGVRWEDCLDTGNYARNPGFILGSIALAAREHGDDEMAEAALRKADQLLKRVDDPDVYAFEGASAAANLNIATARWSRRNDWQELINVGPSREAIEGPLVTDCHYPRVLVARAVSDGTGLDMVLYNGEEEGIETIKIERLIPGMRYLVTGAIQTECDSDSAGIADLQVHLNGRTPVSLRLA